MATILKSNNVATNYIADISGIKDTDYLLSADFTAQKYKLNGLSAALSDVITYTRATTGYKIENGVIQTIEANVPIFNDPITGERGLWSAVSMGNLLGYGICNTNKTITHTTANRIGVIFGLQVFGSGSVTVSGDVELVDKTFTATEAQMIRYRTKANASDSAKSIVNFTVSGNVIHYQTTNDAPYSYNHPTLTTVNKPTVFIKQDIIDKLKVLPEFTVMMRLKPSLSSTPTVPIGLFEITSNLNHAYGIVNTQRNYSVGASDGVNNTYGYDVAANGDTVIAVRYSGSKMTIYRDGLLALEKKGDASSVLSAIQFFATNKFASGRNNFVGLLKNIVVYGKSLTNDELQKLSKSFSW